ncbi:pyridoxamine 5'-phosphate oxidase family protein [Nonomuraea sp. NPDC000554]|uniref:pyridoxamine 5'-phosphate oxidase family protein n=1 Tax=Nonomuraea sp. NPDC000554 TaxID=3154259 RepID=UPI003319D7F1
MTFTRAELDCLATISPEGQAQSSPVGFFVDAEAGTIDIGASEKFRNIAAGSTVAFAVDEPASTNPWTVRGVEIRGTADALTGQEPPFPGFTGSRHGRSSLEAWESRARTARSETG